MARIAFGATIGQALDSGGYLIDCARTTPITGAATAADDAAAIAETDALACQTANVAVTPVEDAIAVLEADGAIPTQAHVNSLRTVWDTLSAACTAHNMAANTAATTATTAKAATAAAAAGAASHHAIFDIDSDAVDSGRDAVDCLRSFMAAVARSYP